MPMPQYNGPTYGYNPYQTYLPQSPWQGPQPYTQPQTAQLPVQQVQTQANPPLVGHIVTANDQIPVSEVPQNGAFGGGYGSGNGGCCAPATCAGLQAGFNNQSVNTMLNGINSGICSLGYDVASQINGVNTNIMQNSYNTANAITQAQFAQQQSAAALQAQLADCCCQNREAISGVNYNMATSTNAVTTAICNAARDITENQNTNYRQLHDELVAYRMEDKDNTIAELRSQVNALNLSASQSNQNAYLVAQLKTPAPVPAYTVPNPNGYYGCQQNCYQSCGC